MIIIASTFTSVRQGKRYRFDNKNEGTMRNPSIQNYCINLHEAIARLRLTVSMALISPACSIRFFGSSLWLAKPKSVRHLGCEVPGRKKNRPCRVAAHLVSFFHTCSFYHLSPAPTLVEFLCELNVLFGKASCSLSGQASAWQARGLK